MVLRGLQAQISDLMRLKEEVVELRRAVRGQRLDRRPAPVDAANEQTEKWRLRAMAMRAEYDPLRQQIASMGGGQPSAGRSTEPSNRGEANHTAACGT